MAAVTATPESVETMSLRDWAMLLVLCGALFLEGLDVSMMGVALPAIQADLGMTTTALQWVVSAYVLGYGGFLLLGGRAADILGRRRMFLGWLVVFLIFSGLGGLATEPWMILVARFVTGLAAAFMTPAGLSIITTSHAEGHVRNRALLIYSGTGAAGFSLGMVAGGVLTEIGWRWVFFAPVVVAALLLPFGWRLIPVDDRAGTGGSFDIAGALGATLTMLLLTLAVVNVSEVDAWLTILTLVAGAGAALGFVALERRAREPLIRFGILRSNMVLRSSLAAAAFSGAFMGFQFLAVLYLQQVRGWSPLETGLAMVIAGMDMVLAPTVTPWLVSRLGLRRVIAGGIAAAFAAYALFLRIGPESGYITHILPTMILVAIAFATAYGPLTIAATDGVNPDEQGLAGGILYTAWQFGAAIGLAATTTVLVSGSGPGGHMVSSVSEITPALAIPIGMVLLSGLAFLVPTRRCVDCPEPPALAHAQA